MTQQTEQKRRKRMIAIVLAVISAAGLVVAGLGKRWLTTTEYGDTVGIGLLSVHACDDGHCQSMSNAAMLDAIEVEIEKIKERNKTLPTKEQLVVPKKPWHGFATMGTVTFWAALAAAAGLAIAALLALTKQRPALPIMPTTITLLGLATAIVTSCIFVATKPAGDKVLIVGWTFVAFGAAAVIGLAAVFPLNRALRPIDDELGEASSTMSWGDSRDDLP